MPNLIIPVYKNQDSLPELLDALDGINTELSGILEVIFVIDGSPDQCYEILRSELPKRMFLSQLILLSRNFGSFAAIRAGLAAGKGEYFAVMAADLQEPPELVVNMTRVLQENAADVVIAVRESRADPLLTRLPAQIFWGLYRRYVVSEIPQGGVDVFACNSAFRDQLLELEERHSSLIAQIFWLGYRRQYVSYIRQPRKHGESAWSLRKKINYLMDSVFSFTDLPIKLLVRIGGIAAIISGLLGLIVLIFKLLGLITIPGYAAIILSIIFFGSLNLFGFGIVGTYAWRTYENTKARPLNIVMRSHQFNKPGSTNEKS